MMIAMRLMQAWREFSGGERRQQRSPTASSLLREPLVLEASRQRPSSVLGFRQGLEAILEPEEDACQEFRLAYAIESAFTSS